MRNSLIILLLIMLVSSCQSFRAFRSGVVIEITADSLMKSVNENEIDYKYLSLKFDADIKIGDSENSIKGSLRICKDSAIWLSITPLMGIEMVRLQFTPDSVWLLERFSKQFLKTDYDFFLKAYNLRIDYKTIQAILSNSTFVYPIDSTENYFSGFHTDGNPAHYQMYSHTKREIKKMRPRNPEIKTQYFRITNEKSKIDSVSLSDLLQDSHIRIKYADFQTVEEVGILPTVFDFQIANQEEISTFRVRYRSIKSKKSLRFPFRFSSKYKPFRQ